VSSRRTLDVYELLPVLYRMLDQEQGYQLRALLEIVGEQAEVVRQDIAGLWDDFFIETCAEWAVPYIGELVGSRRLPAGARRRAVVAKAIHYRRRKGTLTMLEELARDVTGWGARVQPFADLLGWSQSLEHVRTGVDPVGYDPAGTANTPGTVDLRDPTALDRLDGPFDHMSHTADLRPMGFGEGHHNLERAGFFLWRLRRYPVRGATACRAASPNDHGYHFSPLGNPTPLFTRPAPRAEGTDRVREVDVPGPIRPGAFARDLEEHRNHEGDAVLLGEAQNSIYYGPNRSLNILVDDKPVPPDEVVVQNLEDWDRPTPPHKVAVDVRLGRLAFAAGEEPAGEVLVNYNYGFSANLGGGSYYKRLPVALRLPAASLNGKGAPGEVGEKRCRSEGRPGAWVVSGQVLDRQGSPLSGLRVSVFDRDLLWDDRLGEATTDGEGCFEVVYREEDFRDLIEAAPDLYVRVEDEEGRRLHLSRRVRWEAGRAEYFRIVVKNTVLLSLPESPDGSGPVYSFSTLRAAVTKWWNSSSHSLGIIQIADSQTYEENLEIEYWGDQENVAPVRELVVQAAHGQRPTLMGNISVNGWYDRGRLILSGLVIAGCIEVRGGLQSLDISHCTLVPGRQLDEEGRPHQPDQPSVVVGPGGERCRVSVDHSIVGPLRLPHGAELDVADTIVDSPMRTGRATQVRALVSGNLRRIPELGSDEPRLDITVGDEGPYTAVLDERPTTLAQARDQLQGAIHSAYDSPAFAHARVVVVSNWLVVLSGGDAPLRISTSGTDDTAARLRLDSASSRQVCALLGGPLSPFPELSASSPAVSVAVDNEGPRIVTLRDRPASLSRMRRSLQNAINQLAPQFPGFEKTRVASVDDRLLMLPGTGGEAIVIGPAPGDETTLSDLALEGSRPAIAAADPCEPAGPSTRLERTTIFGPVHVSQLSLASEVVFTGPVVVERRQTGEVLYSYVPEGSRTPARRYCQPDLALSRRAGQLVLGYSNALSSIEKDEVSVRLKPTFTSSRYGQPGYAQLGVACDVGITTGAEDGSEMGVFRHLGQPQRESSLRELLDEFLPVELQRGIIYVT
jgi:hypothetical protein